MSASGADEVLALLVSVDLEQFYDAVRSELQITRVSHFKDVKLKDLTRIGLSEPAGRRLIKAAKHSTDGTTTSSSSSLFSSLRSKMKGKRAGVNSGTFSRPADDSSSPDAKSSVTNSACLIAANDLSICETIGSGNFGVVKRAIWRKGKSPSSNEIVAVKILKSALSTDPQVVSDLISEVAIMHKLAHPNLVKLHGVCFDAQNMLVTELAQLGCLLDYLRACQRRLPVARLLTYASQLANALGYLESRNYLHRDIALRNVLLANEETIKLGDFGLARILPTENDQYVSNPGRKIPFAWSAPESLKFSEFTHASDTWMYGVAVWEMFTFGEEPWKGLRPSEILDEISERRRLPKPVCCPTSIYQMLLQCWRSDPDNRPTFAAVFRYLSNSVFLEVKVTGTTLEPDDNSKMKVEKSDRIWVIDGPSDKRWWYGQNKRTLQFGYFLRSDIELPRELSKDDISRPLPGTFVHNNRNDAGDIIARSGIIDVTSPSAELANNYSDGAMVIQATRLETRVTAKRRSQPPSVASSDSSAHQARPTAPPLSASSSMFVTPDDYANLQQRMSTQCNMYARDSDAASSSAAPSHSERDLLEFSGVQHSPTHQQQQPQPVHVLDSWLMEPRDGNEQTFPRIHQDLAVAPTTPADYCNIAVCASGQVPVLSAKKTVRASPAKFLRELNHTLSSKASKLFNRGTPQSKVKSSESSPGGAKMVPAAGQSMSPLNDRSQVYRLNSANTEESQENALVASKNLFVSTPALREVQNSRSPVGKRQYQQPATISVAQGNALSQADLMTQLSQRIAQRRSGSTLALVDD